MTCWSFYDLSKYQYDDGLTTANSPASKTFGAFKVYLMLKNRKKVGFLKNQFSLTAEDGGHRRSCSQNLATFRGPGTECALQRIRITLTRESNSAVYMDQELNGLSSSANMLSALVLPGKSVTAVTKSPAQSSKTLDSSYGFSSQKALVTNTASDLVSFGFRRCAAEPLHRRFIRAT